MGLWYIVLNMVYTIYIVEATYFLVLLIWNTLNSKRYGQPIVYFSVNSMIIVSVFSAKSNYMEKVVNDLHLPNTWDKWDAIWEYVSDLYWSMVDDHIWYKVEEASDADSSLLGATITWGEEEF